MKKYSFVSILVALFLVAACTDQPDIVIQPGNEMVLTARTEQPASKTVVTNETHVYWEPGDEIAVFVDGKRAKFTTNLETPAATATFKGSFGAKVSTQDIWAIYPYSDEVTFDGESFTATIPSSQIARAGSFSKGANISVAHASELDLQFYNVGGGARFTVQSNDIKEVRLKGNAEEPLAGKIQVGFGQDGRPKIEGVSESSTVISLFAPNNGTFDLDTWYYLTAIPGALDNGVTFSVVHSDGTVEAFIMSKTMEIKRGIFGSVKDLDHRLTPSEATVIVTEGSNLLNSEDEEDLEEAFEKFADAADAGSGNAKMYLAYCYEYGLGTEQNMEKAKQLYSEAAAEGVEEALVKQDQLVGGNTNAEINIPGATPKDLEGVVLLCDASIKTPNGDGSFSADENQIVAATSDQKLIYLSFRNPGRDKSKDNLVLDATETALSMLMWGVPFAFEEMTDEEFAGMRGVLLSFTETQSLIVAIRNSVAELGYLDEDRITPELTAAIAVVGQMYGLSDPYNMNPSTPSFVPVAVSRSAETVNHIKTKSGNVAGAPSFKAGSPIYYSGTKVVLDSVEPVAGTDKWKCKILFYNYEPVYLALMTGHLNGGDILPVGNGFLDHIVQPQNSNYIWNMAGFNGIEELVKGQWAYWSDTIAWINGDMAFEDGYWNATETEFEMMVESPNDVLLVYSTSNSPHLFAYTIYQLALEPLLKLFLHVDGSVRTILLNAFIDYGINPAFISKVNSLLSSKDISGFVDLMWETALDVFCDSLDVLIEAQGEFFYKRAIQPRCKDVVTKWQDYSLKGYSSPRVRAEIKADFAELKVLGTILKLEKMAINLVVWNMRQNMITPFYVEFSFPEPDPIVTYETPSLIDLGMPSGVKWASFNLGATKPEESGRYFAWGETTPKNQYDWSTYKWCKGSETSITKYCWISSYGYNGFVDNKRQLDLSDDAANAQLKGEFRTPTCDDWKELLEHTTHQWTNNYNGTGVAGLVCKSTVSGYTSRQIFIPAAGYEWSPYTRVGNYMTASAICSDPSGFDVVYFTENELYGASYDNKVSAGYRFEGHTIRPVYGQPVAPSVVHSVTVSPASYNFGSVVAGQQSDSKKFSITNDGSEDIEYWVESCPDGFAYPDGMKNKVRGKVSANSTLERFWVRFKPTQAKNYSGTVVLGTTDPEYPYLYISVSGKGTN